VTFELYKTQILNCNLYYSLSTISICVVKIISFDYYQRTVREERRGEYETIANYNMIIYVKKWAHKIEAAHKKKKYLMNYKEIQRKMFLSSHLNIML
jgi:hypothetical protein